MEAVVIHGAEPREEHAPAGVAFGELRIPQQSRQVKGLPFHVHAVDGRGILPGAVAGIRRQSQIGVGADCNALLGTTGSIQPSFRQNGRAGRR